MTDICFDSLYEKAIASMTTEEKDEALDLFTSDTLLMMEELEQYTNNAFDIKTDNLCNKQLSRHRAFNKALSDLVGRAYELAEISEKQNQKEA